MVSQSIRQSDGQSVSQSVTKWMNESNNSVNHSLVGQSVRQFSVWSINHFQSVSLSISCSLSQWMIIKKTTTTTIVNALLVLQLIIANLLAVITWLCTAILEGLDRFLIFVEDAHTLVTGINLSLVFNFNTVCPIAAVKNKIFHANVN